jgi:hypothetical protein
MYEAKIEMENVRIDPQRSQEESIYTFEYQQHYKWIVQPHSRVSLGFHRGGRLSFINKNCQPASKIRLPTPGSFAQPTWTA